MSKFFLTFAVFHLRQLKRNRLCAKIDKVYMICKGFYIMLGTIVNTIAVLLGSLCAGTLGSILISLVARLGKNKA